MPGNSIGKNLVVTCFGESHGKCVGIVIDGFPEGIKISEDDIQKELEKRKPISENISTKRLEEDKVNILSGFFRDYSTGAPICVVIWNKAFDSEVYEEFKNKPRPGHADYPALIRYHGYNDYRGGGRFSGRMTAAFVIAGAISKKILEKLGIEILAYTASIGEFKSREPTIKEIKENVYKNNVRCAVLEDSNKMEQEIIKAVKEKDSVGGIIECMILNVPPGIGDPIFDSLDADLAKILFDIPAVKGVEFGLGFKTSRLRGSENNDQYIIKDNGISSLTNNSGGILGGLSNGMPIIIRIALKPTPSIGKKQKTIDFKNIEEAELEIKGKHDPCVVPRAVPVVESAVAIIMADHILKLCLF